MFKLRVTTPTAVLPLTGVNYASKTLTLSATVPVAINNPSYGCGYTLTLSNGTTIARKSMKSSNNLTWTNSTAFTTIIDSNFGLTHNLTFDCNDSTGSYSGEVQQFQVATSTPSIFWYNLSISAQQINLSVNSTTTPICTGIMFNASNVNVSSVTGTAIFGNATINSICNFAINSGQMGSEGLFNLQSLITDSLLNAPTAQLNSSMIYKILIAGWNPITYSGNTINSSTLCNQISGCTQISQINNTLGNYTTYSISTPSINNASSVLNGEGLLVYESTQTDFFENDMLSSATNNVSLTTGWNLIGLTQSTTVNTTLYASGNITQSSKFNILGSYQTCDKTVQICTGSVNNPAQITLPKGYAVWVLANANTSINRTVISG
jgi:hypothetical protein